jgi:hypothetical protein
MIRRVIFLLFVLILLQNNLFALETDTHKALNLVIPNITTPEGFNLDSYLKKNLGLEQGIEEVISENKRIKYWLRDGGKYEDVPVWYLSYVRSVNHFHDPISNKGLKGSANSAVQWALMSKGTQSTGGNYSWFDARDYFYQALTGKDKNTRNEYFGKTFRALGQLTHLVQDMSVPAHTRDDGHIVTTSYAGNYQYYEKWVKANANISSLASNPVFFDLSALSKTNPLGSVPIANLFDTNKFTGVDPNVSTQENVGLSEYTNPNFLSDDTIFNDNFVYPSKKWLELWTDNSVKRKYLKKMYEGEPVNHLAAVSWLYFYRLRYFPQEDQYLPVGLDPECHREYSEKLIPYAVGYSAGLLNYFFRGEIDMAIDDGGYGYVIENNSDEDMNGTFELWYDNDKDERVKINEWSLDIGANSKSSNINFKSPDDAKESCKYILVFKGQMGQEQDAVVGQVVEANGCHLWGVLVEQNYSKELSNVTIAFKGNKNVKKELPIYSNNIIQYKFAEGNPFIFGVLSSQSNSYVVDLFEVKGDMSDVTHLGEVLRINNPTSYYDTSCDGASQSTYSELIEAQDLFISNDGTVVKILGSYKKFVGWKELLRDNIDDCGPWNGTITCVGYPEFEFGYFINEDRYPIGKAPLNVPCEPDFLSANVTVRALNADEQFLNYGLPSINLNVYTVGMHPSGWGCARIGTEDWTVKYNEETKIGSDSVYTHNKTQQCGGEYHLMASDGWSETIEDTSTGTAGSIGYVLIRDEGISISLYILYTVASAISYSSDENGFFYSNENDTHRLINSFGEGYFRDTEGHVSFTSKFEGCSADKTDCSFGRWSYNDNVRDVTFWRSGRE